MLGVYMPKIVWLYHKHIHDIKLCKNISDASIFLLNCIFKVAACSCCVCGHTCMVRCAGALEDRVNTVFCECGYTIKLCIILVLEGDEEMQW